MKYVVDDAQANNIIQTMEHQSLSKADLEILKPFMCYYSYNDTYKVGYNYTGSEIAVFNNGELDVDNYNAFAVIDKGVVNVMDKVNTIVLENKSSLQNDLYADINESLSSINSWKQNIRNAQTNLKSLEKAYASVEEKNMELDFNNVTNSEGVLRAEFDINSSILIIYTDFIQATVYDSSMSEIDRIYVGKLKLKVNMKRFSMRCYPINISIEGYGDRLIAHPHVMGDSACCLGSYQSAFDGAIKSGNIHEIIMVALLWASTVQSDDEAGKYFDRWLRPEEENTLIENKYGNTMFRGWSNVASE